MKNRMIAVLTTLIVALGGVVAIATPAQASGGFCSNVSIRSQGNGKYVSAELGYAGVFYGMLRARASSVGPWERFQLCQYPGSVPGGIYWTSSLKSLGNGKFVSIEWGNSGLLFGMLRARADSMGSWETLMIDAGNRCPFRGRG